MKVILIGVAILLASWAFTNPTIAQQLAEPPNSSGGIRFDPTISAGQLFAILAVLASFFAGYTRIMARIAIIESRVGDLWKDFIDRRPS